MRMDARHSFFDDGRRWLSTGIFFDANDVGSDFRGVTAVTHEGARIRIDGGGDLALPDGGAKRIENFYTVERVDASALLWQSQNPAFGTLAGTFHVYCDSITSVFSSEDGTLLGTETLVLLESGDYIARGVLLKGGSAVSKWAVTLTPDESREFIGRGVRT